MQINTTRFGRIEVAPSDRIAFPSGILGLDDCRDWVLLADAQNDALGWLQSIVRREIALAVVSPRRFVPDYQLRVSRRELAPLELDELRSAHVLVVASQSERGMTLNLKAPIMINLERRLGRQVVSNSDYAIRHELTPGYRLLKTA